MQWKRLIACAFCLTCYRLSTGPKRSYPSPLGVLYFVVPRKYLKGMPMRKLVQRFLNDHAGATAIEYALIAAGISIVIVVAVNSIGTSLNSTFSSISSQLK